MLYAWSSFPCCDGLLLFTWLSEPCQAMWMWSKHPVWFCLLYVVRMKWVGV